MQFALIALALASLAVATPTQPSACNSGSTMCCNTIQKASSLPDKEKSILAAAGIDVARLTGTVGASCTPITAIGLGTNSCNTQTVCCTGNNFSGLVVLGCSPINAAL